MLRLQCFANSDVLQLLKVGAVHKAALVGISSLNWLYCLEQLTSLDSVVSFTNN